MRFSLDWLRAYMELPETADQVAELLAQAGLPVDAVERWGADHTLDVDILANRPDCMCHLGLARELAARTGRPLRIPETNPTYGPEKAEDLATIEIVHGDLCSRYTALILTGVSVGPSPSWLQDRLASIGLRPINNLVDATNFVLHEMGQPLHAFDLDRLDGARVVVRRARAGEHMQTLDGENRSLEENDLVIADASRALAIAGVMGGADSEIASTTTRVLLESAHFAPEAVRRTSRRLGLHTDASHRFERGTDPGITLAAALRAADLIQKSGGGTLARGEIDVQSTPPERRSLCLSSAHVGALLGLEVACDRMAAVLTPLGFQVSAPEPGQEENLVVKVPTWRVDVREEVDLIEEVARMVGYDQIPATVPAFHSTTAHAPRPAAAWDRARSFMAAAGFAEAIHFPMASRGPQERFAAAVAGNGALVTLDNPMNRQMDTLRASLLPGLLNSLAHNRNRGRDHAQLFESGRIFREKAPASGKAREMALPVERTLLAAVSRGHGGLPHWGRQPRDLDFYDLKGILEGLVERAMGEPAMLTPPGTGTAAEFLDPLAAAQVNIHEGMIGWIGRLAPAATASWDLPGDILAFEIDLTEAPAARPLAHHTPLPRHPAAERDLAIILPAEVRYHSLEALLRACGGSLLESVSLFDRYEGSPIPAGRISLAVRLTFRAADRTLTAPEVQNILDTMVSRLRTEQGGEIRDT